MTDKTLGAYERHESPDYADGGVAAALIEEEDGVDAAASRLAAFARKFGVPPEWTTAPAVQAWHRSDHRTEHDGTPGQPRIWSPDYKTTETWSTPSLRNVHWSDLVDVTPLAPVRGCPDSEQHTAESVQPEQDPRSRVGLAKHFRDRCDDLEHRLNLAVMASEHNAERAEKAERERDEARGALRARLGMRAESRPLTPDAITDEMVGQFRDHMWDVHDMDIDGGDAAEALRAALTETPARPEGAEELARLIADADVGEWDCGDLADALIATGRVHVDGEEDPR